MLNLKKKSFNLKIWNAILVGSSPKHLLLLLDLRFLLFSRMRASQIRENAWHAKNIEKNWFLTFNDILLTFLKGRKYCSLLSTRLERFQIYKLTLNILFLIKTKSLLTNLTLEDIMARSVAASVFVTIKLKNKLKNKQKNLE